MNATNAIPSSMASPMATLAPTEASGTEAPSPTSTSAVEAAKGAASRLELGVMVVVLGIGSLMVVL